MGRCEKYLRVANIAELDVEESAVPKYTPGPWKMRPNGELWSYSRGEAPELIGSMSWTGRAEDREGNARVLAGAVDLCESMDEVMLILSQPEVVEAIQSTDRISAKSKMILENARVALFEATGKRLPEWPTHDKHDHRLESS